MLPTVVGVLVAGQFCAADTRPFATIVVLVLISVFALSLMTDRRGPRFAAEALTLAVGQFGFHHTLELVGSGSSVTPGACELSAGTLGCTGDLGWRDLLVVVLRVALALFVLLGLHLVRHTLQRFVLRPQPRLVARLYGVRQLVSCRARRARALELMVLSAPRRGPPVGLPVFCA